MLSTICFQPIKCLTSKILQNLVCPFLITFQCDSLILLMNIILTITWLDKLNENHSMWQLWFELELLLVDILGVHFPLVSFCELNMLTIHVCQLQCPLVNMFGWGSMSIKCFTYYLGFGQILKLVLIQRFEAWRNWSLVEYFQIGKLFPKGNSQP